MIKRIVGCHHQCSRLFLGDLRSIYERYCGQANQGTKIIDTRDDCLLMIEIGSTGIASGHGASPDKRGRISWNIGPIVELDDLVARGPYFGLRR